MFPFCPVFLPVCRVLQWAPAKDGTGSYYYNMSNSQMTVTELPEVADTVSQTN